jgi:hypothetical protein
MSKQRFSETVTFDEICIYDMDAFDVARALRRDGINRGSRVGQVLPRAARSAFAWQTGSFLSWNVVRGDGSSCVRSSLVKS